MINIIRDLEGYLDCFDCRKITKKQWTKISERNDLSVQFCERYYKHIRWELCSVEQHLSNEFIQVHKDELKWNDISSCTNGLSESFIAKYYKKVNWHYISKYQTLSETFIAIFSEYVDWENLQQNNKVKLSEKFRKRYNDKLQCK